MNLEEIAKEKSESLEAELQDISEKFNRDIRDAGKRHGFSLNTEVNIVIATMEGS